MHLQELAFVFGSLSVSVFASVLTPMADVVAGWWRHVKEAPSHEPEEARHHDPGEYETGAFFHFGRAARVAFGTARATFRRPFEISSTMAQVEHLGVHSAAIAITTAALVGMVMSVQFAYGLQRFGGMEYTGRFIGLSFARELAPTLTGIVVGSRMAAGIAAEIGAMAVSEQIDAIKSLGSDPLKKLVVPRILASMIVLPVLSMLALITGFVGAMVMTEREFGIPWMFFYKTALQSVKLADVWSGLIKTPVFGFLIALIGAHFGLLTRGGTEGVGKATTRAVVVSAIAVLVSDFFMTQVSVIIWPNR